MSSAVNLSQNPIAFCEVFNDEISSRPSHDFFRTLQPGLLLVFAQLFPTDYIQSNEIASSCKPDSPHSSVFAFFDVANGIPDLHARGRWIDSQQLCIAHQHPWSRTSCSNLVGADRRIWSVASRRRVLQYRSKHLPCVSRGSSNEEASLLPPPDNFHDAWDQRRMLDDDLHL